MVRHRNRQRATHEATVTREEQVGEDDYGSPIYDTVEVLTGEPVVLHTGGRSFVREATSERVREAPTISGRGDLAGLLEAGDLVTLGPLDPEGSLLENLEVRSIDVDYNRHARAGGATIELEGI